jgi:hypothetical protein
MAKLRQNALKCGKIRQIVRVLPYKMPQNKANCKGNTLQNASKMGQNTPK